MWSGRSILFHRHKQKHCHQIIIQIFNIYITKLWLEYCQAFEVIYKTITMRCKIQQKYLYNTFDKALRNKNTNAMQSEKARKNQTYLSYIEYTADIGDGNCGWHLSWYLLDSWFPIKNKKIAYIFQVTCTSCSALAYGFTLICAYFVKQWTEPVLYHYIMYTLLWRKKR